MLRALPGTPCMLLAKTRLLPANPAAKSLSRRSRAVSDTKLPAAAIKAILALVGMLLSAPLPSHAQITLDSGRHDRAGRTYLPTGACLDPAGRSFAAGNMPLALAISPEGDRL